MEPIRRTLTVRLGYLKMYRDEVDQLVAIFQQSCGKVTISDSKYRYDSLEDMKKNVTSRIVPENGMHGLKGDPMAQGRF